MGEVVKLSDRRPFVVRRCVHPASGRRALEVIDAESWERKALVWDGPQARREVGKVLSELRRERCKAAVRKLMESLRRNRECT